MGRSAARAMRSPARVNARSGAYGLGPTARLLTCLVGLAAASGGLIGPLAAAEPPRPTGAADFYDDGAPPAPLVALGRSLFFDKILSGNRNISCATCHHPSAHTGDDISLSLGEGGRGLGTGRTTGVFPDDVSARVPRNAQPLFNLGAKEFTRMLHDGRVEVDPARPGRFLTPAGDELPDGLDNVLAAQAMFPVLSPHEMAGLEGENPIATAVARGHVTRAWSLLEDRLRDPRNNYIELFVAAFPDIGGAEHIRFVHAANAIAAFTAKAWRADGSPFDRYLRGDREALDGAARRGMGLFYGPAGCAECHSGKFQTDHQFHSVGLPQIGPGKGNGFDGHEDFGRERVTGLRSDRYKFRTPSLRNVALTGPWGHDGAYASLDAIVRHHRDPRQAVDDYVPRQAVLPSRPDLDAVDLLVQLDPIRRRAIAASSDIDRLNLTDQDVADLIAFLHALTDPASIDLSADVPKTVPSGLPVRD